MRTVKQITALVSAVCITTYVQAQGNLTPPGAPAPTMKTLQQIEPRIDVMTLAGDASSEIVITNSGSYYLSTNLDVTKANGIHINAPGVTLDLNGFLISRVSGSGGTGVLSTITPLTTVRNGGVVGFEYGILANAVSGSQFENLSVSGCTSFGMLVGVGARIIDCGAHDNSGIGIYAGKGSSLTGCIAYSNQGAYGIYSAEGSVLTDCTAYDNESTSGIYAHAGSTLSRCVAHDNHGTYGIRTQFGCTLQQCSAFSNNGTESSSYGIFTGAGSAVLGCSAYANGNTNTSTTAVQGVGVFIGTGSSIKNCTVKGNKGDGIYVSSDCLVERNTCVSNGLLGGDGAGIHVTSSTSRIESNNVIKNDRGIDVDAAGNFIVRNTAVGNGVNYSIAVDNKVGEIVNAPTSGIINGTTGGAGVGSTSPWANFSF